MQHNVTTNNNQVQVTHNEELITGGTKDQDLKPTKFTVNLTLKFELSESQKEKFSSKSEIYLQLKNNFAKFGRIMAGPVTGYLKNTKELILKGEIESDYLLFKNSKWLKTFFDSSGIESCGVNLEIKQTMENTLVVSTFQKISPTSVNFVFKTKNFL
jgi:hypothetical protein